MSLGVKPIKITADEVLAKDNRDLSPLFYSSKGIIGRTEANVIRTLAIRLNPTEALAQCISVDELSRDEMRNAVDADLIHSSTQTIQKVAVTAVFGLFVCFYTEHLAIWMLRSEFPPQWPSQAGIQGKRQ